MASYVIFHEASDSKNCLLGKCPEALDEKRWRIAEGLRMDERYPPDVTLQMDEEHRGLNVPDLVANTLHLCIVSGRLKALLEQESGANIEFLPAAIANHKGRRVPGEYFIANVLDTYDCVDRDKSDFDTFASNPDEFTGLFRLSLREDEIPANAKLFRIKPMGTVLVIREDLRAALEAKGMTGVNYIAMGKRCSIY